MRIIGNNPAADNAEITAVASGTLPSGQPVIVNANGTVSVVGTNTVTETVGSSVVFEAANSDSISATYDANAQKVVVAYRDAGNSYRGTAVVGTISGTSLSFGTPVVFETSNARRPSIAYDANSQKVVISYNISGSTGYAIVGTVSGTSISFGTRVSLGTQIGYNKNVYDSSAQKVIISFQDQSNYYGSARVGTVSGTSISFGTQVVFASHNTYLAGTAFDSTNNKVVIAYANVTDGQKGTSIVGTVSGTNISFGSAVVFDAAECSVGTGQMDVAYDAASGKSVIVYMKGPGGNAGANAIVGTISGTGISFGTAVVYDSGSGNENNTIVYHEAAEKVIVVYWDNSNSDRATALTGTVSGTTISFANSVVLEQGASDLISPVYDPNNEVIFVALRDGGNSSYGTGVVYQPTYSSTNITAENFIGFSGGSVEVSGSANQVIGSETNFETGGRVEHLSAAYDANAQKVVIAYRDNTNSNYGTAIVGTVSGTSITFGTAVVYHADATNYSSIVYDENAQKVVIAYQDDNDSNKGTAIVGTVSGTGISFGSPTVFDTDNAYINTVYDANAQKIVISYNDGGNSDYGTAVVGTVSGASISFGTPVVFTTTDTRINDIVYDSTAQKVVVAYRNFTASDAGTAVVGTVSGTSISFGTPVVFDSGGTDRLSATYDTVADAVVIFYGDKANSYYGTAIVGTVSGTSISFGTKQVFESAEIREFGATYDSVAQRAVLGYRDVGNTERGTIIAAQVDGTTMTFGTTEVFAQDPRHINATYDSGQGRVVFAYDDEIASRGRSCVVEVGYENITRGSVASGSNAVIDIGSAISTNQLSLTAGQQYFVQTDGTLGLTAGDPSVIAGTAVSATDIIVKG